MTIPLSRFKNPCRNFSPIRYKKRLQTFHLVDYSQWSASWAVSVSVSVSVSEFANSVYRHLMSNISSYRAAPSLQETAAAGLVKICISAKR